MNRFSLRKLVDQSDLIYKEGANDLESNATSSEELMDSESAYAVVSPINSDLRISSDFAGKLTQGQSLELNHELNNEVNKQPEPPAGVADWLLTQVHQNEIELVKLLRNKGLRDSHILMAISRARQTGESLLDIMRPEDYGFLSMEQIAQVIAQLNDMEYIDGFEAARLLDEASLEKHQIVLRSDGPSTFMPLCVMDDHSSGRSNIEVLISDTQARSLARHTFSGHTCQFRVASEGVINNLYRRVFGNTKQALEISYVSYKKALDAKDQDGEAGNHKEAVLMALARHACYAGASDIRMQPMASGRGGQVLLRIDGIYRDLMFLRWDVYRALINVLIDESGKSEELRRGPIETVLHFDGSRYSARRNANLDLANRYAFRVELIRTLPEETDMAYTTMVARIIDNQAEEVDLHRLGIDSKTLEKLASYLMRRAGILFTTGAVGSGKSTLQTACLRAFVDPIARSVQTIDNPREFAMGTWMQYQQPSDASEGEGATNIATGLLRNAVDVAVPGETRTPAMAKLVMQMANMAVFCMTTMHNNKAVSAIARLKDLGIEYAQIADTVCGILALALLRILCPQCKISDERSATMSALKQAPWVNDSKPFRVGPGCPHCHMTGYRGRKLTYELLDIDVTVAQMIHGGAPLSEIEKHAIAPQDSMYGHGLNLVGAGEVDLEQVVSL
ncbi:Flp pilus assembly complex ATPase component TadA [Polynucleobacter sp. JS-Safj-400b-B2]|uniref:GspE/PulE family protein n=1 Tax=Polynucleobacter sp. JS-Safj-400b-B2 TaxID=2576921 RepID=UPI001C0E3053|nr:Flp pilus assembly complex ATPase component TadA [Polynucleobacter sp. JS-Safj-400b-B2]